MKDKDNLIVPIALISFIMLGVGLSVVGIYRNMTPHERCQVANEIRTELGIPLLKCGRRSKR